jgi:hypothetical protein
MPQHLTDIAITEVSLVDNPANTGARVVFFKRAGETQKEQHMATTKSEIYALIKENSEALRKDGQSPEQAFAAYIQHHPDGERLFNCLKLAPGPEIETTAAPVRKVIAKEGSALQQLNELAAELAKREGTTEAQAFAKIYKDECPPARALAAQERAERYAKMGMTV